MKEKGLAVCESEIDCNTKLSNYETKRMSAALGHAIVQQQDNEEALLLNQQYQAYAQERHDLNIKGFNYLVSKTSQEELENLMNKNIQPNAK